MVWGFFETPMEFPAGAAPGLNFPGGKLFSNTAWIKKKKKFLSISIAKKKTTKTKTNKQTKPKRTDDHFFLTTVIAGLISQHLPQILFFI